MVGGLTSRSSPGASRSWGPSCSSSASCAHRSPRRLCWPTVGRSANLVPLAANGAFAGAFVLLSLHLQLVLGLGALRLGSHWCRWPSAWPSAPQTCRPASSRDSAPSGDLRGHGHRRRGPRRAGARARRGPSVGARASRQHRRRTRIRHRLPVGRSSESNASRPRARAWPQGCSSRLRKSAPPSASH